MFNSYVKRISQNLTKKEIKPNILEKKLLQLTNEKKSDDDGTRMQRLKFSNKNLHKVTSTYNLHPTFSSVSSYQRIYRQFNSKNK